VDGAIVIDLMHFQHFSMDRSTWRATIGGGTLLGDVTKCLHDAGNRAMAHGICPQVGIGGHATIGGLGPTSRQWGSALDHVEEVEVVLADSTIVRASQTQHPDLFWALKGAGAGFGVITEFVVRTEPEPGTTVKYAYSFTLGTYKSMVNSFKDWQKFVSDPNLTRKFASEVILTQAGMIISGTYFGSKSDFDALGIEQRFFGHQKASVIVFDDWLGVVAHWAEEDALKLGGGISAEMMAKSLTFNTMNLIPDNVIEDLFDYLDRAKKGTPLWFAIFNFQGGAVTDVAMDATAYAHRDALFYLQSYAVDLGGLTETTKTFVRGINKVISTAMPSDAALGTYAGYVDPELANPQQSYWRSNLPRLEMIKRSVDPSDLFHNPQSVRPALG